MPQAATSVGGLMVAAHTSVAREYHAGLSAMLGIHAALAASQGYGAEEHVLEMPRGFFSAYGGDHLEDLTKDHGTITSPRRSAPRHRKSMVLGPLDGRLLDHSATVSACDNMPQCEQ